MLASWVAEPLLTGPGAGGYLLVAGAGEEPTLLDFFVEAPGRGADPAARAELAAVEVSFGDAVQVFNVGAGRRAATYGIAGRPGGGAASAGARSPLADARRARGRAGARGRRRSTPRRPTSSRSSSRSSCSTRGVARGLRARRAGRCARASRFRSPRAGRDDRALRRRGRGAVLHGRPRRRGRRLARARAAASSTRADLAAYEAIAREPVRAAYRGRQVLTNPPPSAGGTLLALAMARLDERRRRAAVGPRRHRRGHGGGPGAAHAGLRRGPRRARLRRPLPRLAPGLDDAHLGARRRRPRLRGDVHATARARASSCPAPASTSTTSWASRTSTRSASSRYPPGRRMPSMMAPDRGAGRPTARSSSCSAARARTASARRSCRSIVGVVDHGLQAHDAVLAPRVHFEDGVVYAEPGIDADALRGAGREVVAFRDLQPVLRRRAGGRARPRDRRALGRRRPAPRRRRGGGVRRAAAAPSLRWRRCALAAACGGEAARPLPRHPQRRRSPARS